jgi:hypothetical protein
MASPSNPINSSRTGEPCTPGGACDDGYDENGGVPCHVRHKHMPQPQVTECIHEASHYRQANEQHRQRAVRAISGGHRVTLSHGSLEEMCGDLLTSGS